MGYDRQAFSRIKLNKPEIWVVLYPEGTRWTEKKLLQVRRTSLLDAIKADASIQAQAFGRERSRTELQHLLLPRTKGFVATIQGMPTLRVPPVPVFRLPTCSRA